MAKKRSSKGSKPKSVSITIKANILDDAPVEKHFVLVDGQRLKNIRELVESLEHMGEHVFKHHVSELKNDFSNWVNDVFNEKELAENLKKAANTVDSQLAILKHLVQKLAK